MKGIAKYFADGYKRLIESQCWSLYMYVTGCYVIITYMWLNSKNGALPFSIMLLLSICNFMTVGVVKCMVKGTERELMYTVLLRSICDVFILIATVINGVAMLVSIVFLAAMQILCKVGAKVEEANREDVIYRRVGRAMLGTLIFGSTVLFFVFWGLLGIPIWFKILVSILHLTTVPFLTRLQEQIECTIGEMLFTIKWSNIDRYKF